MPTPDLETENDLELSIQRVKGTWFEEREWVKPDEFSTKWWREEKMVEWKEKKCFVTDFTMDKDAEVESTGPQGIIIVVVIYAVIFVLIAVFLSVLMKRNKRALKVFLGKRKLEKTVAAKMKPKKKKKDKDDK